MKRIAMLIAAAALLNACGGGSDQAESQASASNEPMASTSAAGSLTSSSPNRVAAPQGIVVNRTTSGGSTAGGAELVASTRAVDRAARIEPRNLPAHIASQKLTQPITAGSVSRSVLDSSLLGAIGEKRVIVRLSADSAASALVKGADTAQAKLSARAQQDAFLSSARALDPNARVVGRVQAVMNAVFIEVDAAALPALANDPRVMRIAPVGNYQKDLSTTVPYIGATAVQAKGVDGRGIKVAVLDSGIDYLHAALGGSGNPAHFAANDPQIIEPGTFPTAKVVGGYDFTGPTWPNTPEIPDPDPLDAGVERGHGTHVAHIIAGKGGVAPGASLYAVKVCSSVSTACSGIALIQGIDFAADPNGDGKLNDRVDIINMSLGSSYGQPFDDDLSVAVDNATAVGILTVASSGNSFGQTVRDWNARRGEDRTLSRADRRSHRFPAVDADHCSCVDRGNFPAVFQPWSAPLTWQFRRRCNTAMARVAI